MDTFTNPELLTDLKNMLGDGYKTEEHSTSACCYNNERLRSLSYSKPKEKLEQNLLRTSVPCSSHFHFPENSSGLAVT